MRYQSTRLSNVGSTTGETLERIAETLHHAGVTMPDEIESAVKESKTRRQNIKELRASAKPEQVLSEVSRQIADGTADLATIYAAATAKNLNTTDPYSPLSAIFNNALSHVSKDLHQTFKALGDSWITDVLRPEVDRNVNIITDSIPELAQADPTQRPMELETMMYNPQVVQALGALRTIYGAARSLRSLSIIPSTFQRDDCYEFAGSPGARDGMQQDDITWFVWAIQNNHKPGIYTETDNNKHWK